MKTVALFGGSFDPFHIGHEAIVTHLLHDDEIESIIVMPTYLNPLKDSFVAPAKKRLKWLQKLYKDEPKVEISDFEVTQKRKVPTIESVKYIKKRYNPKKVFVVIGMDNFVTLHKWQDIEKLKKEVEFIVVGRDDQKLPHGYKTIPLSFDVSSTSLREKMQKELLPKKIADEIYTYYKERDANKS